MSVRSAGRAGNVARMGAWGHGSFENDSAMDWLGELAGSGPSIVGDTLADVADETVHLDLEDASAALAAAELVAAAHGKGDDRLDETAVSWLAAHRAQIATVDLALARRAVERVFASSELREIWDESDEAGDWHANVRGLIRRLTP